MAFNTLRQLEEYALQIERETNLRLQRLQMQIERLDTSIPGAGGFTSGYQWPVSTQKAYEEGTYTDVRDNAGDGWLRFDRVNLRLVTVVGSGIVAGDAGLLESGDFILLESGDKLLLEA